MSFSGPRYKSQTHLWGYDLSSGARRGVNSTPRGIAGRGQR
jgi:hypothetical protein